MGRRRCRLWRGGVWIFLVLLLAGLHLGCEPRRTKNLLDRVYELDPGGKLYISPTLKQRSPKNIAILPFHSLVAEGRVEGSSSLFNLINRRRTGQPELLAQAMRRSFFGQMSELEFDLIKLSRVDEILKSEKLDTWEKVQAYPAASLGGLLQSDALISGRVTHFDYYYAFLYSQLAVGLSLEMVDAKTGEILWRVRDARRDHTIRVVLDPISLAVGLFQVGFSLRSINMTRASDEICRELAATIPPPR